MRTIPRPDASPSLPALDPCTPDRCRLHRHEHGVIETLADGEAIAIGLIDALTDQLVAAKALSRSLVQQLGEARRENRALRAQLARRHAGATDKEWR